MPPSVQGEQPRPRQQARQGHRALVAGGRVESAADDQYGVGRALGPGAGVAVGVASGPRLADAGDPGQEPAEVGEPAVGYVGGSLPRADMVWVVGLGAHDAGPALDLVGVVLLLGRPRLGAQRLPGGGRGLGAGQGIELLEGLREQPPLLGVVQFEEGEADQVGVGDRPVGQLGWLGKQAPTSAA